MATSKRHSAPLVAAALAVAVVLLFVDAPLSYADECPAGGQHDFDVTIVTPVTDDADGLEYLVCSKCGESRYRTVPATGHQWSDWYVDTPATCTTEGIEARVCTKHPDNVHYEYRLTPPLSPTGEHQYVETSRIEPTCTESGMAAYACSLCGDSYSEVLPAQGHDWGAWETVRESTETEQGLERRVCLRCGEAEERDLPLAEQVVRDEPIEPERPTSEPAPSLPEETPWYATEFFTAGPTREDAVIVGSGFVVCAVVGLLSVSLGAQVMWLRRKQAESRRTKGARYAAEHAAIEPVSAEEGEAL